MGAACDAQTIMMAALPRIFLTELSIRIEALGEVAQAMNVWSTDRCPVLRVLRAPLRA
jgi:hypothetical protein